MEDGVRAASQIQVSAALSRLAYDEGRFRLVDPDLAGHDCLVASRQGLFTVARTGEVKRIAYGFFFGIRRHGEAFYVFEACDRPAARTDRGRIVKLELDGKRIAGTRIIASGLDNQCHQLAIINDHICLVDTASQAILRFALDGTLIGRQIPIPLADGGKYHHINSIAHLGGRVVILLHNGGKDAAAPSELAWLDEDWQIQRREELAGHGCHDIVEDEAGVIWQCGSLEGAIINSAGLRRKVTERMTRGLAITPDAVIVGASDFGARDVRYQMAGSLLYLDRQLTIQAEVQLPAAPTDIVLL
jgi:hypothetical protein